MGKRAAIYARVSTKDQKDNGYSLPTQVDACAAYARECGYEVVCEAFQDDFTGMSMDRPALDRLREAIPAFNVNVVLVLDLDRLARKTVYQMLIEEEFARMGVTIEYVNGRYDDSDEGRLQKHIKGAVAEYERAKILERMKRGKLGKAKSGKVIIGAVAPYGYRKVGTGQDATLVLDEVEAAAVRRIFDWYIIDGLTVYAIVDQLSAANIPPRGGSRTKFPRWSTASLAKILNNEMYTGVWYYNKMSDTKQGGRRVVKQRPREEWIGVPVPAIIDAETFAAARDRSQANQERAKRNRKHDYIFAGMINCGQCQCTMFGRTLPRPDGLPYPARYYCTHTATRYKEDRCTMIAVTEPELNAVVWPWIMELVNEPDKAIRALDERQAMQAQADAPLRVRLAEIDEKIADHARQLKRLLDTFDRNPDLPGEWFDERKARLMKMKGDFERERTALLSQLEAEPYTPERIADIVTFLSTLRGRMEQATPERKRDTLKMLNFKSYAKIEKYHKVLYVVCALGQDRKVLDDCVYGIQCT